MRFIIAAVASTVKYCNRQCQIAHRSLHKKACKKRAAELHDAELFKEHPPNEDCPICFLPLPHDDDQITFHSCCGKVICRGCIDAMLEEACGRGKIDLCCAFCREPTPSSEEAVKQIKKLMESENANAFHSLAGYFEHGDGGMPQDFAKANEFWLRAGELGCAVAYHNLGNSYYFGRGVEVDKNKAKYFYELSAMNGDVKARHNLGCMEGQAGNHHRAYKHFILAAKAGYKESLGYVVKGFVKRCVTKDEYADTLHAYQERCNEMKSDMRDKARDRL